MNPQTPLQTNSKTQNIIFQSLSVIFIGILVSLSILISTGADKDILRSIWKITPKFSSYTQLKDISNYQDLYAVFANQPQISNNSKSKLLLVESSDFNCLECGKFYGYQSNGKESSFSKIKIDYIDSGKIDYTLIDNIPNNNIKKSNAMYCAAEQDPKLFFEFKDKLFEKYNEKFDLNIAKSYINKFGFDTKKFEDCFNSEKYKDRISNLTKFSTDILEVKNSPVFYIYLVENTEVLKTDGSKSQEKKYTKLDTISGNIDYDLFIKSKLDKLTEQYKN